MSTHAEDFELGRAEKGSIEDLKENKKLIEDIEELRKARREEAEKDGEVKSVLKPLAHERTSAQDMVEHKPAEEKPASAEEVPAKKEAAEQSDKPDGNSLTVEERLDLMDKELELRDLKLERVQQKAEKWETLAQRRAGELNHIRQSEKPANSKLEKAEEDLWSELDNKTDDSEKRSAVRLNEFEEEALATARQNAQLAFLNEYEKELYTGKGDERKLDPEFVEVLTEVRDDYQDELASHSPKRVRKATEAALKEARLTFRERRLEKSLVEARSKRAVVSQEARERKLASQVSESTSQSTNEADTRDFENLSADEMADALSRDKKRSGYY
jgi:hypothetical protein